MSRLIVTRPFGRYTRGDVARLPVKEARQAERSGSAIVVPDTGRVPLLLSEAFEGHAAGATAEIDLGVAVSLVLRGAATVQETELVTS